MGPINVPLPPLGPGSIVPLDKFWAQDFTKKGPKMKELTITLTRLHTGRYITIEARVVDDHHYPETSVFERLEDALKYIEGSMLRDQVEAKLAGDPIGMVEQLHQYGQAIPFNERTYQEMKAYFAESAPKLITKGKKP